MTLVDSAKLGATWGAEVIQHYGARPLASEPNPSLTEIGGHTPPGAQRSPMAARY